MIQINADRPDKSIIPFVKDWFVMMSDGRSEEACRSLDEPNCYGTVWTPDLINELLLDTFGENYGDLGPPHISDPNDLRPVRFYPPEPFDDGSGYFFDHDVPINGEWSDLTAQFEFKKREKGFAVILHDLHVL